ncbi:MAG: oxaloacetate-decarboxylating malate dehydrogenase [Gemmatimonadales bacterium]|nr:oxaloacetate-decarboxylating malate dehydrogenase [Gemmatimonadales bacterium]
MQWSVEMDPETSEEYIVVSEKGRPLLLNPFTNKGSAFTKSERDQLHLHGLLPPAICSMQQQLDRAYENYQAKTTDLERFIYLASLHDRNETLFFRLLHAHIDEMMPIVYTPVVGEACQKYSHIYRRARGLYISYEQRDKIEQILANHPTPPAVIVVTDGERILGLGDQGAGGMGIPVGKLCLYTLCAGIPPYRTLPIMLDVGTDNEERLKDPLYLGARHRRIRGAEYQAFVDSFVEAVMRVYPGTLLQWEDFLKANAIKQLKRFRDKICSFNDDIQGTAGVVLAGISSGLTITGQRMRDQRVLFAGAGASAWGISDLLVTALIDDGLSRTEARKRIWTVDSRGLVTKDRPGLEEFKATYARSSDEVSTYTCKDRSRITLEEAVLNVRPTILIGTSGSPGVFTRNIIQAMAKYNQRPMVFPLSNPTSNSECTAEEAIRWSGGRAIVATGSPFAPVQYRGKTYRIGQGNNALVFPGVGLGVWVGKIKRITDGMFLDGGRALADRVVQEELAHGAVYPELSRIRECSHAVACAVIRRAVAEGHADKGILDELEKTVERAMWYPEYRPIRYEGSGVMSEHGHAPRAPVCSLGALRD